MSRRARELETAGGAPVRRLDELRRRLHQTGGRVSTASGQVRSFSATVAASLYFTAGFFSMDTRSSLRVFEQRRRKMQTARCVALGGPLILGKVFFET